MQRVDLWRRPDFFHGIYALSGDELGFCPYRLSPQLRSVCSELEIMKGLRARGDAGVRLMAHSDSELLVLRFEILSWNDAEHGIFSCFYGENCVIQRFISGKETTRKVEFALPPGDKNVTVYFPWQAEIMVRDCLIDDGSTFIPVEYGKEKIVFIGDSITEGMLADAPENSFPARLSQQRQADFWNMGVGGLKMRSDFALASLYYPWNFAILAFGVNDASLGTPLTEFDVQAKESIEFLCTKTDGHVAVMTPIYWPDEPEHGLLRKYRESLTRIAAAFDKVQLIPGEKLLPAENKYYADGVHPNDLGMMVMAEKLNELLNFGVRCEYC